MILLSHSRIRVWTDAVLSLAFAAVPLAALVEPHDDDLVFAVEMGTGEIFIDGFESGDTSAWD